MSPSSPPDSPHRRYAENIVRQIVKQRHIAYFAGGCVRDELLGLVPADYDVATSATPDEVQAIFGPRRTLLVGAAFGVVCIHQQIDGISYQVEVATFRTDGAYSDGRRPDRVDYSTPEIDAQRRDFTINGLFYDPIEGKVIDFVGGQEDLNRRVLRAIGDPRARFAEDKLRLLRAVRIAARFDLAVEKETRSSITAMATSIVSVSPERIAAEMRKMLEHPSRSTAVQMMVDTCLLEAVFSPFASPLADPNTLCATRKRLDALATPDFVAALAVLGHPCFESLSESELPQRAKAMVEMLQSRWRLSNQEAEGLLFAWSRFPEFRRSSSAPWSVLQPLLISPHVSQAIRYASAVLIESQGHDRELDRCRSALSLPADELNPPPLVDGQLLMSLGLPTGPLYARVIKSARAAQLDRIIQTPDAAREWVQEFIRKVATSQ